MNIERQRGPDHRAAVPVAGIGASARRLVAFEAFFSGMPANGGAGMAFPQVQLDDRAIGVVPSGSDSERTAAGHDIAGYEMATVAARLMGSEVDLASAEGAGSTFSIELPAAPAAGGRR
jgi:hypothetical protein